MRFWTNVGVVIGFMSFSLPFTTRTAIRYRFVKGLLAGTLGIVACAPVLPWWQSWTDFCRLE